MTLVAIDVETTGLNRAIDDFVQLAATSYHLRFNQLALPAVNVDPGATQSHGHTYASLEAAGVPTSAEVAEQFAKAFFGDVICGHNLAFDLAILSRHPVLDFLQTMPAFCTYHAAVRMMPGLENHQLATVVEALHIKGDFSWHDAYHDAQACWLVAMELCSISKRTPAEMVEWLKVPMELAVWPSGKFKGHPFQDTDTNYLRWVLSKDFLPDISYSCKKELERRSRGS